jgi:cell division inhibitor SulA
MKAAAALAEILARPDVWCADRLASAAIPALASGFARLDAELPGGGWPRGALTEILADNAGLGECSLLLPMLGKMREEGRWSLLVAPPHGLNSVAWAARGIDLARLAVVSPSRPRDALWAAEHALGSGALGALLCWTTHIDAAQVRRLQVAAAGSNTLVFLFRPASARSESSAAALRLLLAAGSRARLAVNLLKRRGPPCTRTLYLDVPRPLTWRADHESCKADACDSALARPSSAVPCARSQRPLAFA